MSTTLSATRAPGGAARRRLRRRPGRDTVAVLLLVLLAAVAMGRQWDGRILWDPDSLFYQARVIELRTGAPAAQVLHRVFTGPLSGYMRSLEAAQPAGQPKLLDQPGWAAFSAPFYARRLLVPALAAAITPIFGLRSLKLVALVAYLLLGPGLYGLLRQRFGRRASLLAAAGCLLVPSVRTWAGFPLTDTWSLVLEAAALGAALRYIDRGGRRWMVLWLLAVGASSITHDAAFVPVAAIGVAWLCRRSRRRLILLGGGFAACLPAALAVPVQENVQLASAFSGHGIPHDTSWSWVLGHYGPAVGQMLSGDGRYLLDHPLTATAYLLGLALALAGLTRRRRDPFLQLTAGLLAGYGLQLALGPSFSAFRYELELVPVLAVGYGWGLTELAIAARRIHARHGDAPGRLPVPPGWIRPWLG